MKCRHCHTLAMGSGCLEHLAGAFADQQTCRATDSTNTTKETRKRHEKCRKMAETAKKCRSYTDTLHLLLLRNRPASLCIYPQALRTPSLHWSPLQLYIAHETTWYDMAISLLVESFCIFLHMFASSVELFVNLARSVSRFGFTRCVSESSHFVPHLLKPFLWQPAVLRLLWQYVSTIETASNWDWKQSEAVGNSRKQSEAAQLDSVPGSTSRVPGIVWSAETNSLPCPLWCHLFLSQGAKNTRLTSLRGVGTSNLAMVSVLGSFGVHGPASESFLSQDSRLPREIKYCKSGITPGITRAGDTFWHFLTLHSWFWRLFVHLAVSSGHLVIVPNWHLRLTQWMPAGSSPARRAYQSFGSKKTRISLEISPPPEWACPAPSTDKTWYKTW